VLWAVFIVAFTMWAVVIPFTVRRVRKVRADRRWLREREARKRYPTSHVIILDETAPWREEYDRQAAANRAADPEWFTPKEI
jgi:hypothetical protein